MEEHTHVGDPTYFAYVHCGCRHPDCKAAATEYRQRLQARRRRGDWRDLRFKADAQTADSGPQPVVRERPALPETPANPQGVEAVTEPVSNTDALLALVISMADGNGNLPGDVLSATVMGQELGIRDAEAHAAIRDLWGKQITAGARGPKLVRRA